MAQNKQAKASDNIFKREDNIVCILFVFKFILRERRFRLDSPISLLFSEYCTPCRKTTCAETNSLREFCPANRADIFEFLRQFREYSKDIPVVVVPTTYNQFREDELHQWGANIVIYANHMLRASYPAMLEAAKCILKNSRSLEADNLCMSIKDILELIPGGK